MLYMNRIQRLGSPKGALLTSANANMGLYTWITRLYSIPHGARSLYMHLMLPFYGSEKPA